MIENVENLNQNGYIKITKNLLNKKFSGEKIYL